jgi:hypothetical protein
MELQCWRVDDAGNIQFMDVGAPTGKVGALRIGMAPNQFGEVEQSFGTVVTTAAKKLKVIPWNVSADGSIERTQSDWTSDDAITKIALAPDVGFVAALRGTDGKLRLRAWDYSPASLDDLDYEWNLRASASAGGIEEVAITPTNTYGLYVTAVRMAAGFLRVILWKLT